MIISQRGWDYNEHYHVDFFSYVQESQVYDTNNTNFPRTLDGMYLCPTPNLQGGNQDMDLRTVQLVTRPKIVEISITYVVIKAVEKCQRCKYLIH